jgi:acetyl-CoA carboxylase biotin carboxyl carrier protein
MEITHDDVKKILEIVDNAKNLEELELRYGGFHLRINRGSGPAPAIHEPARAVAPPPTAAPAPAPIQTAMPSAGREHTLAAGDIAIRAPMVGTFYRSPAPGEPPFVQVGQRVGPDDTLCLIEVMKLFTSIKAGVGGVVKQIVVVDSDLVEFDQLLIIIGRA